MDFTTFALETALALPATATVRANNGLKPKETAEVVTKSQTKRNEI